ncbi:hypothetical protein CerSpe_062110 [Prunus speciosa]|uniref:Trafficking protein particle complex subunit 2 isoform X1 n=1 Tax=Prunus avium TaxID=42229 RepID=A0A6P5TB05_PRUAV|nr:trafficking protein particle complex subunit 2 isoform X1 [Prunus avium]
MATTACFVIVSRNDIPIYEAEVGSAAKREDAAQLHQFILHAALDIVQDLAWTTSAMYLKAIDRFNDLVVSVYVTAGHDLCYFMTPVMMMVSRASSKRFMSSISRLFLIPSTCLVPESLHRILIPKFVPLHENICRGHASCGKTSP